MSPIQHCHVTLTNSSQSLFSCLDTLLFTQMSQAIKWLQSGLPRQALHQQHFRCVCVCVCRIRLYAPMFHCSSALTAVKYSEQELLKPAGIPAGVCGIIFHRTTHGSVDLCIFTLVPIEAQLYYTITSIECKQCRLNAMAFVSCQHGRRTASKPISTRNWAELCKLTK